MRCEACCRFVSRSSVVAMTVSFPLATDQFTASVQQSYIAAVAAAANVPLSVVSVVDTEPLQRCSLTCVALYSVPSCAVAS